MEFKDITVDQFISFYEWYVKKLNKNEVINFDTFFFLFRKRVEPLNNYLVYHGNFDGFKSFFYFYPDGRVSADVPLREKMKVSDLTSEQLNEFSAYYSKFILQNDYSIATLKNILEKEAKFFYNSIVLKVGPSKLDVFDGHYFIFYKGGEYEYN